MSCVIGTIIPEQKKCLCNNFGPIVVQEGKSAGKWKGIFRTCVLGGELNLVLKAFELVIPPIRENGQDVTPQTVTWKRPVLCGGALCIGALLRLRSVALTCMFLCPTPFRRTASGQKQKTHIKIRRGPQHKESRVTSFLVRVPLLIYFP